MKIKPSNPENPNPQNLCAILPCGTLIDFHIAPIGSYGTPVVDILVKEVIPRIEECVNAMTSVENPQELLREAAGTTEDIRVCLDMLPENIGKLSQVLTAKGLVKELVEILPEPPKPVTLSPYEVACMRELIDSLVDLAEMNGVVDSDQMTVVNKMREILQ